MVAGGGLEDETGGKEEDGQRPRAIPTESQGSVD